MPFGVVSGIGRKMGELDGGGDFQKESGSFGGKCGAFHYNQWGLCGIVVQKCMSRSSCHLGSNQTLMY